MSEILKMLDNAGVWGYVITFVLGLAPVAALVAKYKMIARELLELISVTVEAFEDNKIDDAEIAAIWKEAGDVKDAIKKIKEKK